MARRGKERVSELQEHLLESSSNKGRAPKGYVPVLVGKDAMVERFLLRIELLSDPGIKALLDMAADEWGYKREGILRIPCEVDRFREVVSAISKAK